MKTIVLLLLLFITATGESFCQKSIICTKDINNFWLAFDTLKNINSRRHQNEAIKRIYFDRASEGLMEFIKIRGWTPEKFQISITNHDNFWKTVRPRTLNLSHDSIQICQMVKRYKHLYRDFKTPEIYFVISPISTGGTTTQNHVLIGTEISCGDSTIDATGLNPFLKNFYKTNKGVVDLVAHELTHTQQKGGDMEDRRDSNLLGFCLAEGMCDFIAELLLQHKIDRPYITYGEKNEKKIWYDFQKEMQGKNISGWLYNGGIKQSDDADLGYFVGYAICKSYYRHAKNKRKAIKAIISLKLEDTNALSVFLDKSLYGKQFD